MMELKDLVVSRRANSATYTEVEPEGEESLGGLAGLRQKGGRWRRITLVCVTMMAVIGLPLFIYLMVNSAEDCKYDYWEKPELIEDDVTILELVDPTKPMSPLAAVFFTVTDIADQVCSSWRSSYPKVKETSYLYYSLLQFNGTYWNTLIPAHNRTGIISEHGYITSAAVVEGQPVLLIEDAYERTWTLLRLTGWMVGETLNATVLDTYEAPESDNIVFTMQKFDDGTVVLLRENQESYTKSIDTAPLFVKKLPVAPTDPAPLNPAGACSITMKGATESQPTYWWSIGTLDNIKYLYYGYENVTTGASGSKVQSFYGMCKLNFSAEDNCGCNVVEKLPWSQGTNAIYWDDTLDRVMLQPSTGGDCQWYNITNKTMSPVEEEYDIQFCETGTLARMWNADLWTQPDMINHQMTQMAVPHSIKDTYDVVSTACVDVAKPQPFRAGVVSSAVTAMVGQPSQLIAWVARPLPIKEERYPIEVSNWVSFQSLAQQKMSADADGEWEDSDLLQCPCLPNFAENACPQLRQKAK